jgi:hypothetical protein
LFVAASAGAAPSASAASMDIKTVSPNTPTGVRLPNT